MRAPIRSATNTGTRAAASSITASFAGGLRNRCSFESSALIPDPRPRRGGVAQGCARRCSRHILRRLEQPTLADATEIVMKVVPLALLALLVVPLHAQGPNDFDATRVRQLLASIQKQLPEAARDVGWLTDTVPQKGTIPAEVGQQLEAFEQALRSGANNELRSLIREELE